MKGKGFFTRRTIGNMIVVAFGVLLYLAFSNFGTIREYVGWFFNILKPFVIGIGMAYLLNMPMMFLERTVFKKMKRKRRWSLISTYVLFVVLIALLLGLIIPQLVQSVGTLVGNIPAYLNNLNELVDWATETFKLDSDMLDVLAVSYSDLVNTFTNWIRGYLPQLVNMTVQFGSGIISVLTAFIASLYMLTSKDKLLRQTRKVIYAALPPKKGDEVYRVSNLSNRVFSGFISGKILDSAIIGMITYVFMLIMDLWVLDMPFAPLIAVIIGVTNIIPFFGPFIGAIPSVLILLLVNPWSAIWFVVFVIVLQQFDGNLLGPKILGETTGLPAFWVLIAIIVGGGLFGFAGMVLGVPTVAVLYTLASDVIDRKYKKRQAEALEAQITDEPVVEDKAPAVKK